MRTTYKLGTHTIKFDKTEQRKLEAALDVLHGLSQFEGESIQPAIEIISQILDGITETGTYVPGNLDDGEPDE